MIGEILEDVEAVMQDARARIKCDASLCDKFSVRH
jgi:hypothetical protein